MDATGRLTLDGKHVVGGSKKPIKCRGARSSGLARILVALVCDENPELMTYAETRKANGWLDKSGQPFRLTVPTTNLRDRKAHPVSIEFLTPARFIRGEGLQAT